MSYTEQQYKEFQNRMEEQFPKMFATRYGGFGVSFGWWRIVETLCANIQEHINSVNNRRAKLLENNEYDLRIPEEIPQVLVTQVKEKFGALRFYYDGGNDAIHGMVRMAESWADCSCETCGAPGKRRSGGWIRTLCDEHERQYQLSKDLNNE